MSKFKISALKVSLSAAISQKCKKNSEVEKIYLCMAALCDEITRTAASDEEILNLPDRQTSVKNNYENLKQKYKNAGRNELLKDLDKLQKEYKKLKYER